MALAMFPARLPRSHLLDACGLGFDGGLHDAFEVGVAALEGAGALTVTPVPLVDDV